MEFSRDDLNEAKRQIDSTLHKLRETIKTFESKENQGRYKSQITLARRRVKAFEIAKNVAEKTAARDSSLRIDIGNPLASVEELELLASADYAVIFSELQRSKRKTLTRWQEVCARYSIPVAGAVAVETCW